MLHRSTLSTFGLASIFALLAACSSSTQGGDGAVDARADIGTDALVDTSVDRIVPSDATDTPTPRDVVTCGATVCADGQVCCDATQTCYNPACLSCCMPGPDVVGDDASSDVVVDAPRTCTSTAECNTAAREICVFATAGCGVIGTCEVDFDCGRVSLPYCNCDGVTFFDHCAGPDQPWVSSGECPMDASADSTTDATNADVVSMDVPTGVDALNDSGGGACSSTGTCGLGLACCGSNCVNFQNDPLNCGACGVHCTGSTPMCAGGTCSPDLCSPPCGAGSVCCAVNHAGPVGPPACYVGTTCPVGCPLCL